MATANNPSGPATMFCSSCGSRPKSHKLLQVVLCNRYFVCHSR